MAAARHFGEMHVGAAVAHGGGGLGRQQIGVRPPDQCERQARERVEGGPGIARRRDTGGEGFAQGGVVVVCEPVFGLGVEPLDLGPPAALGLPSTGHLGLHLINVLHKSKNV